MFFCAAERFFETGEAGPRMGFWGAIWGDTPKIEIFEFFSLGVFDGLINDSVSGGEFAVAVVAGGLHVKSGGFVVEKQGSSQREGFFGNFF